MRRTGRRHRDGFPLRDHILAIYVPIPETTIASREKLGAGLLEAFYPTIENVNNGLVHRNSLYLLRRDSASARRHQRQTMCPRLFLGCFAERRRNTAPAKPFLKWVTIIWTGRLSRFASRNLHQRIIKIRQ